VSVDELLSCFGVTNGIADIDGILAQDPYPVMAEALYNRLKECGCTYTLQDIQKITVDAYHKNVCKGLIIPACEDIFSVVSELKNMGLKLAVVTTDDPYDTQKCLSQLGIDKLFDEIYTDDGVFPVKPDPYCIYDFCKKEGVSLEEVIMVGDTLNDVRFAKNGGIGFIGVAKDGKNREILLKETDNVVPDISYIIDMIK